MKSSITLSILVCFSLLCGSLSWIDVEGSEQPAAADAGQQIIAYSGCVKIFDGRTFDGWEADPSAWSIIDGVMRGEGGTSRLAYTKTDYGSFPLIFTARMNPVNGDHLGVLFWGDRPMDSAKMANRSY